MSFDQYNQFQRMEDPDERKAEEISSKGESRRGFKKKSTSKSVTLRTFRAGTSLAGLLVWLLFIAAVAYGTYLIIQQFSTGG